jgi:hypothetical protein
MSAARRSGGTFFIAAFHCSTSKKGPSTAPHFGRLRSG